MVRNNWTGVLRRAGPPVALGMKRSTTIVCVVTAAALFGLGCDDGANPPPSAAPSTPLGGLSETPSSLAGRSAAAGRNAARQAEQGQQQAAGLADELAGNAAGKVVGGIEFAVPTSWEEAPATQFQAAQYRVGDGQVVFFANIGGGVENNINRWRQQVKTPEGSPADAKVEKRTISGMEATVVSMNGTYQGMGPGGAAAAPVEDAAFRAIIYSGPAGDVFVRFTGPRSTVEANEGAWEQMILGAKKQ